MAESAPVLEQRAKKAPLPCYGLEFERHDPRCQACPHQISCTQVMGQRLNRVPLSKIKFRLTPKAYGVDYDNLDFADPEVTNMEATYQLCFKTIFRKSPAGASTFWFKHKKSVEIAARKNECAIRLYMLAVMTAHRTHCADVMLYADRSQVPPFTSSMLLGKRAQARFETFRDLTAKEFGAFSLSSLGKLIDYNFEQNSPEQKLLDSEIKAGQCIIDFKMTGGGPFYERLYQQCELTLNPLWLAVEESYLRTVIKPYREKPRGSSMEKYHRHDAIRTMQHLHSHAQTAIMVFQAREAAMARAIPEVLRLFGYGADDFLIANQPVTNCLDLWNWVGRAIQHDECLRYVNGLPTRLFRS